MDYALNNFKLYEKEQAQLHVKYYKAIKHLNYNFIRYPTVIYMGGDTVQTSRRIDVTITKSELVSYPWGLKGHEDYAVSVMDIYDPFYTTAHVKNRKRRKRKLNVNYLSITNPS